MLTLVAGAMLLALEVGSVHGAKAVPSSSSITLRGDSVSVVAPKGNNCGRSVFGGLDCELAHHFGHPTRRAVRIEARERLEVRLPRAADALTVRLAHGVVPGGALEPPYYEADIRVQSDAPRLKWKVRIPKPARRVGGVSVEVEYAKGGVVTTYYARAELADRVAGAVDEDGGSEAK